jgi:hypothetical protein
MNIPRYQARNGARFGHSLANGVKLKNFQAKCKLFRVLQIYFSKFYKSHSVECFKYIIPSFTNRTVSSASNIFFQVLQIAQCRVLQIYFSKFYKSHSVEGFKYIFPSFTNRTVSSASNIFFQVLQITQCKSFPDFEEYFFEYNVVNNIWRTFAVCVLTAISEYSQICFCHSMKASGQCRYSYHNT